MTKSIKEKKRLLSVSNIRKNGNETKPEDIKVKIKYHSLNKKNSKNKSINKFSKSFESMVGKILKRNAPRLLVNVAKFLNLYEFELKVRFFHELNVPNRAKKFAVSIDLMHKNHQIGSFCSNWDDFLGKQNLKYVYTAFYKNISLQELLTLDNTIELLNSDDIFIYSQMSVVRKFKSAFKNIHPHKNTQPTNPTLLGNPNVVFDPLFSSKIKKISNCIAFLFRNELAIPIVTKNINWLCLSCCFGKNIKVFLDAHHTFDGLSVKSGKISRSYAHSIDHDVKDSFILNLLKEVEILPNELEYSEKDMTNDEIFNFFEYASLMKY